MMGKEYKKISIIFAEFLCVMLFTCFFMLMGIAGSGLINGNYSISKIQILESSDMDIVDNIFCTNGIDPWILVNYDGNSFLYMNVAFDEDIEVLDGRIYYADENRRFSEENAINFQFKNGENIIRIDDRSARYLRLDMGERAGFRFEIKFLYEETIWKYLWRSLTQLDFANVISISALVVVFYEFLKREKKNRKEVSYLFFILLCVSVFYIFKDFILGRCYYLYSDMGADTIDQYYPYFLQEVRSIRNGTFGGWIWNYGMGTSILNVVTWTMDPFAFCVVVFGVIFGTGIVHHALVWMQIIKIIIAYLLCKKYIKLFCENELAISLGAYLYALNGYLLLWGQHYFLGTACVFVLIVLIGIEKYLRWEGKKGGVRVALAVAWTLIYSFYTGYMILLVSAVYFVVRYFALYKEKPLIDTLKIWGKCIFSVLSGVFLSGIVFFPTCYYTMTNSLRLNGITGGIFEKILQSFVSSFDLNNIAVRMSRLLSNNFLGINDMSEVAFSNVYEMPQLFCTVFIFFFIGQWVVYEYKKAKKGNTRVLFVVKLFLLYLLIFNSVSGLILNAFAYAAYRYTFVLFPFMTLGVSIIWEKMIGRCRISGWGIVIGALLTIYSWGYSYNNTVLEVENYTIAILFVLLFGFALFLYIWKKAKYATEMINVLLLLVVIATTWDGYISTNQRRYIKKSEYGLNWENGELSNNTEEAIEWIKEQDDSFYRIDKTYADWRPLADSFVEGYSTVTCYNSTQNKNVVAFYENIYPKAVLLPSVTWLDLSSDLSARALSLANVKYILSQEPLNYSWCKKIKQIGEVSVYKNSMTDSMGKWYKKTISKDEFLLLNDRKKAEILEDTVIIDEDMILDNTDKTVALGEFALERQTQLTGTVFSSGTGILMMAIPDQEGWSVFVDGERAETFNADYGFIGVKLDKGEHIVSARYSIPKKEWGILTSILGVVMMGGMLIIERRNRDS